MITERKQVSKGDIVVSIGCDRLEPGYRAEVLASAYFDAAGNLRTELRWIDNRPHNKYHGRLANPVANWRLKRFTTLVSAKDYSIE